jgi:transposase-like protein
MTKGKNYQRYPAEFKRMALLKASEGGATANAVCEELGISFRQLSLNENKATTVGCRLITFNNSSFDKN